MLTHEEINKKTDHVYMHTDVDRMSPSKSVGFKFTQWNNIIKYYIFYGF